MANKLIQDLTAGAFALTDLLEHQPIAGPPSLKGDVAALVTLLNTIYAPITGGAYVLKAGDTMTGLLTIAQATANTSNLILSGQSLTGANAQSLVDMAGTWNTSGTPIALKLNITNTASNAASLLLDVQSSTISRFRVGAAGTSRFTVSNGATLDILNFGGGATRITSSGFFGMDGPAGGGYDFAVNGVSVGDYNFNVASQWSFASNVRVDGLLRLLGETSAFPALKRSATTIQGRLADDSAFCTIQAIHQVSVNATAAAPPVTTHTIPFVDAAGVTYRVPCLV